MEATNRLRGSMIAVISFIAFFTGILMFSTSITMPVKLIGAFAAAIVVFVNPLWGIYLVILAIPFITNELLIVLAALVIGAFIVRSITDKRRIFTESPLNLPIAIYILVEILTTVFSVDIFQSAKTLIVEIASFGLFFVIINTVDTKEKLNDTVKIFILITFILSCYGIFQYFFEQPMNRAWVDKTINPNLSARTVATFDNPNIFAEYLEHMLPVTIALFFAVKRIKRKCITGIVGLTMLVCLVLTFSRGSWLGFAASMMLLFIVKFARYIPLLVAGGIASLPLMPQVVLQRIISIGNFKDTSNTYRVMVWEGTINMIKDFWLTGVGFGYIAYKNAFLEYCIKGARVWHSHNLYLEIIAEMGIFGILTFVWIMIMLLVSIYKFSKKTNDRYLSYLSIGLVCSIIALLVHGIGEHILYLPKSIIMFWMVIALAMCTRNIGMKLQQGQVDTK